MNAEFQKAYAKIVARAWSDGDFKARLLADPAGVLREHGIHLPKDFQVEIKADSKVLQLPLPPAPGPQPLDEKMLEAVSGGLLCWSGCGT